MDMQDNFNPMVGEDEKTNKTHWRVLGRSVRGASHIRVDKPNQDAICWVPESGAGLPLILALSDGHGSTKYFRSNVGSQMAVESATTVLQTFLTEQVEGASLSAIKRIAEERLPQSLVRAYSEQMHNHLAAHPFTDAEWQWLNDHDRDGLSARLTVEAAPILAYGATLLVVLVTHTFIIYLQLGDGDILTVSKTGEVERPLPGDDRLFADETTSLCAPNAWRDFRFRFQALSELTHDRIPALILAATDGYGNAFRDEAGFLKVGSDLLEIIRSDGLDAVNNNLEQWLAEASQAGSGDDVTLGIICCTDPTKEIV